MKLVDDWKQAWKWLSVNCMAVAGAIQCTWLAIPDDMRSSVPPALVHWLTLTLLIAGIAGRLIRQDKPEDKGDDHHDRGYN
jgi:hypothetical protein